MNKRIAELVKNDQAEEGMQMLISRYQNLDKDVCRLYSAWKAIRRMLYTDEANRAVDYTKKMNWLCDHIKSPGDSNAIIAVLQLPLSRQHALHSQKMSYLEDREYNILFKSIRPLFPQFYKFNLPDHVKNAHELKSKDIQIKQQLHAHKDKTHYNFTVSEIDSMFEWARRTVDEVDIVKSSTQYYNLALALQLLTGRRNNEIAHRMLLIPTSHPMQATVVGISKKTDPHATHIIPLMYTFDKIENALHRLRDYSDTMTPYFSQGITKASKRVFNRNLVHTQKRSIYAEAAYKNRKENEYMPSATKMFWVANALCHDFVPSATQQYQTIEIKEDGSPRGTGE